MSANEHDRSVARGPMTTLEAHDRALFDQEYLSLLREADTILQQAIEPQWKRQSRRLGACVLSVVTHASYGLMSSGHHDLSRFHDC